MSQKLLKSLLISYLFPTYFLLIARSLRQGAQKGPDSYTEEDSVSDLPPDGSGPDPGVVIVKDKFITQVKKTRKGAISRPALAGWKTHVESKKKGFWKPLRPAPRKAQDTKQD